MTRASHLRGPPPPLPLTAPLARLARALMCLDMSPSLMDRVSRP